ncbi:hypothetical protein BDA99DRAFT_535810 [Phascolomyces articulosus]|uniref:Uncharacterized protein n=1 Tax=Phascolomyces articulosus TaxID=60185 RepID=A0AAD5K418_9FUNG|nr:hypothetical protein BDA99DRAFT_535810 [Phascolomyces articulosus]
MSVPTEQRQTYRGWTSTMDVVTQKMKWYQPQDVIEMIYRTRELVYSRNPSTNTLPVHALVRLVNEVERNHNPTATIKDGDASFIPTFERIERFFRKQRIEPPPVKSDVRFPSNKVLLCESFGIWSYYFTRFRILMSLLRQPSRIFDGSFPTRGLISRVGDVRSCLELNNQEPLKFASIGNVEIALLDCCNEMVYHIEQVTDVFDQKKFEDRPRNGIATSPSADITNTPAADGPSSTAISVGTSMTPPPSPSFSSSSSSARRSSSVTSTLRKKRHQEPVFPSVKPRPRVTKKRITEKRSMRQKKVQQEIVLQHEAVGHDQVVQQQEHNGDNEKSTQQKENSSLGVDRMDEFQHLMNHKEFDDEAVILDDQQDKKVKKKNKTKDETIIQQQQQQQEKQQPQPPPPPPPPHHHHHRILHRMSHGFIEITEEQRSKKHKDRLSRISEFNNVQEELEELPVDYQPKHDQIPSSSRPIYQEKDPKWKGKEKLKAPNKTKLPRFKKFMKRLSNIMIPSSDQQRSNKKEKRATYHFNTTTLPYFTQIP